MYIRTNDGVYENAHPYFTEDNKVYMCWDYPSDIEPEFLGDIIKQSENIDELCDEYCYIKDGVVSQYLTIDFKFKRDDEFCALRNKLTANGIAEISKGISKYELENGELKFAIWTEWGLKYVAKMNDKGELELI